MALKSTVSEAVGRPVRTATQGVIAGAFVEAADAWIYDMNDKQYASLLILLTIIVGWIQVLTENKTGWAFLRNLPQEDTPVVEEQEDMHGGGEHGA